MTIDNVRVGQDWVRKNGTMLLHRVREVDKLSEIVKLEQIRRELFAEPVFNEISFQHLLEEFELLSPPMKLLTAEEAAERIRTEFGSTLEALKY